MTNRSRPTESTTRLFAIHGYSKLGQMPAGSTMPTLIRTFFFRGDEWEFKVSPCVFVDGVPSCVSVWVTFMDLDYSAEATNVSIEILDRTSKRNVVFHEEDVLHEDDPFVILMVKRRELEVTSCVRKDSILVRVHLTAMDVKKHKRQQRAVARSELWRWLRRSLYQNLLGLKRKPKVSEAPPMKLLNPASRSSPAMAHHLIKVPGYSKLARTDLSLTLRKFRFLGDAWSITLYPSGYGRCADSISIMVVNNAERRTALEANISIGILDQSHDGPVFYNRHTLGNLDNHWCKSLMISKKELEASSCLNNDSFTITCTLTILDKKQQHHQQHQH